MYYHFDIFLFGIGFIFGDDFDYFIQVQALLQHLPRGVTPLLAPSPRSAFAFFFGGCAL